MNILIPDAPEFAALGKESFPGMTFAPYRASKELPQDAEGLVLWGLPRDLRGKALHLPSLKWVLTLSAGVEHVIDEVPERVTLYNASRLHDDAVAQHALATLLSVARGLPRARDAQREHRWARLPGLWTLENKHVVVWGFGHIGRRLEAMLAPLGARVTGLRSRSSQEEVGSALSEADALVLLLPATDETRGLVNAEVLARLKKGAWLANFGRGSAVVTADLIAALQNGHLGGAILDVTDPEPLPPESPLWSMENVLITPHVASATSDMLARAAAFTRRRSAVASAIAAFMSAAVLSQDMPAITASAASRQLRSVPCASASASSQA